MLTERRASLLSFIIQDYVDTALPVGSEYVVRRHRMPFSSATVRLEMARLEEDGYITHPHTSAGRIPSDKGYRYYVEALMEEEKLAWEQQETIRHQFHQAERALEEWFQLAAAVLAQAVRNFAVVTSPRSKEARLRHLQLVALQEFSALCVVVLQEARLHQQVVTLKQAADQETLSGVAARLNARYGGLTLSDLGRQPQPASEIDELVALSASHHPYWRASVDGEPARVVRLAPDLVAVPVPRGRHTIELRFVPPRWIGWLAGVTVLALLAWLTAPRWSGAVRFRGSR